MRLIDADYFKQYIQDVFCDFVGLFQTNGGEKLATDVTFAFLQDIDEQPTVDAKPIVRCIDCKWHEHSEPGMVWCPIIEGSWIEENFFCAYGAKMDLEGDE